ncbi:hypothetical protein HZH66_001337 [Vespula vulgaris]|uniref:DUF302 domain-containing protein n=1 Tax=Vespula vulgaris TaxID=7454 RepID=A0A834KYI8_VESVU|nr:hypothetical protein HZH66_001337 [Vespula vulgaris]
MSARRRRRARGLPRSVLAMPLIAVLSCVSGLDADTKVRALACVPAYVRMAQESAWKFECLSEASIELTIVDTNRPVRKVGVRHPRHVFVSMFHCRHGAASGILLVDLSSRNERKVEFRNAMIGVPYDYTLSIHSLSDFIKDIEAELARHSRESKREKKRVVSAG